MAYNRIVNLTNNVKPKPKWWSIVPFLAKFTANAIWPNIYLPREVYDNLKSNNPRPKWVAVLKHEQEHLKREKEIGPIMFGVKYLFSSKIRFEEELIAIEAGMKYLKSAGEPFDTDKSARFLSSWLYLWPVPYEEAKRRLDKLWAETRREKKKKIVVTSNYKTMTKEQKEGLYKRLNEALSTLCEEVVEDKIKSV